MQVTETLSDGLKRAYTVVLPAADIESKRAARFTRLIKTLRIPGFRPGKVPLALVKQRYGTAVSAEILEESVNDATRQVLADRGLRPALQPKVEVANPEQAVTSAIADLEFKMELELLPDISMPDFSAISLTRLKAEPAPATTEEMLGRLALSHRELVEIPAEELQARGDNQGAADGDVLTVDFNGKIDGVEFEGGKGTDIDVDIGGTGFIPGFAEQVAGMKPGDSRTIDVTFPADYGMVTLAGKAATFDVTAKQLRKAVTPEIDDELAKKAGFDTVDALRAAVVDRTQREYDSQSRTRLKRQLLDVLSDAATFLSPETMVNSEFDQIWQRLTADRDAGRLDEDDKAKDEETLRTEYRAIAERRVRLGLLLAEIGRINNLTVTQEELTRSMINEATRYPGQEMQMLEFFRKYPQMVEQLRGPIFEDKVVDFVLALANVTDLTVTPDELAKDPPAPPVPTLAAPVPDASESAAAAPDASEPVPSTEPPASQV